MPFFIETRVETVKPGDGKKLEKVGCAGVAMGVESGSLTLRKSLLDRFMPDSEILRGFKELEETNIRISANNIIGFPYETRKLAFDTIRLNRTFNVMDRTVNAFVTFQGIALRKITDKLGYTKPDDIQKSIKVGAQYDMPQFKRKEIKGFVKTFNYYCSFPEERLD